MFIPTKFNKIQQIQNNNLIPLTFISESTNSTIVLNSYGKPTVSGLQYRYGSSDNWKTYICGTELTLENIGDKVQFQNINN